MAGPAIDLMLKGTVSTVSLECDTQPDDELGTACISTLLSTMQKVFKHNFVSSKQMFIYTCNMH